MQCHRHLALLPGHLHSALVALETACWDVHVRERSEEVGFRFHIILASSEVCGTLDSPGCITTVRSDEVVHYEHGADWRTTATEHGQHLVLAHDDAGALLSDPSTWRVDGIGAGVMLCESYQADGLSFDAWFGKLAGLPDRLIYEHPRGEESHGGAQKKTLTEPEEVLTARLWMSAIEHAAADGLPLLCPVSQDAYLDFDWEPTSGETARQ